MFRARRLRRQVRVVRADNDQLIDVCALLEQIGDVIRYRKCGDLDVDVVVSYFRAVAVELRPDTLVILGFRASCGRRPMEASRSNASSKAVSITAWEPGEGSSAATIHHHYTF